MVKIMAVDDEPDILNLLKRILERAGYQFVGCPSGEECLEKYGREKPDLVMLDIMMPGMDGWRLYKQLMEINKRQKVAFLTVLGVPAETKEGVIEMGAADYITKPFEPAKLLERVKTILKK
ncbi:MAG: response regulator transcription factor [Hadesarchaea archaeon]|nr:response regulator transcription factor [Hadesarchaea archaeon]